MAYNETVTQLLNDLKAGRREAYDELLPKVYDELRRPGRGDHGPLFIPR